MPPETPTGDAFENRMQFSVWCDVDITTFGLAMKKLSTVIHWPQDA